jgi:hypothetical protein
VVRLSAAERETLEALISKGKHPAARILKAMILLKADVSGAGEGLERRLDRESLGCQPGDRLPHAPTTGRSR